ncbi:hypothetical protein [Thauera sp.]|uniref:hypothetical protein n=1 Tax=Thauera sp. TaxID=1905334 RepID=UPI0039E2385C
MSTFTVTASGLPHVLRSSEYIRPDHSISLDAVRIGWGAKPGIRLHQTFGLSSFNQELSADMARALAAELLACADAIDAVMAERGKA